MNNAALWYTGCHIAGDHMHHGYQLVGATVGTCVYKTANIKGKALHVA